MSDARGVEPATFLTARQVRSIVTLSKTTMHDWIKSGRFPAPYRLGPGRVGFKRSDIDAWIESRPRVATDLAKPSASGASPS